MKKLLLLLSVLFIVACGTKHKNGPIENNASLSLSKADMSEYVFLSDQDHSYLDMSAKDFLEFIDQKGTGIVYFGYSKCPWCNRIVPVLNEVAKERGINIYYVNLHGEANTNEEFNKIVEYLDPILQEENGKKEFFVPEVVSIKDGEIKDHKVSVVASYSDFTKDFTKSQRKEMLEIYHKLVDLLISE